MDGGHRIVRFGVRGWRGRRVRQLQRDTWRAAADVVRHFEEEGFHYVGEIPTGKAFANSVDGRTSVVKVVA